MKKLFNFPRMLSYHGGCLHELGRSGSKHPFFFLSLLKEELRRIAPLCPLNVFPIILGTDTVQGRALESSPECTNNVSVSERCP